MQTYDLEIKVLQYGSREHSSPVYEGLGLLSSDLLSSSWYGDKGIGLSGGVA